MSYLTDFKPEAKTLVPSFSIQKPKECSLIAKWLMVDGQLVCQWLSIEV